MIELGELEAHSSDFKRRGVQVVAISNDDLETARMTQADFPHLVIVSDAQQNMAKALRVIHPKASPQRTDTNAPTTMLVDGDGTVRWLFRPGRVIERLAPAQVTRAIDAHLTRSLESTATEPADRS